MLKSTGVVTAGMSLGLSNRQAQASPAKTSVNRKTALQKVAARIRGPLAPLFVPMTKNEQVDYDAMGRYVDWLASNGVPLMWLTYGTSEYTILSEQEILELIRVIADANAGRAVFISCTDSWPTKRCIPFVKAAAKRGADVVKVLFHFGYFPTDFNEESLYQHYLNIAEATDVPLFGYTSGQPGMSSALVGRLAAIPQMIGMKNDTGDFHRQRAYCKAGGEHFIPMTGGFLGEFLYGMHFNAKAYADVPILLAPKESVAAYKFLLQGKMNSVVSYIERYERPLLDLAAQSGSGFRAFFRTMLWLMGHFNTNVGRRPHLTMADEKIPPLRKFLEEREIPVAR